MNNPPILTVEEFKELLIKHGYTSSRSSSGLDVRKFSEEYGCTPQATYYWLRGINPIPVQVLRWFEAKEKNLAMEKKLQNAKRKIQKLQQLHQAS